MKKNKHNYCRCQYKSKKIFSRISLIFIFGVFFFSYASAQKTQVRINVTDQQNVVFLKSTAILKQLPDSIVIDQKVLDKESFFEVNTNNTYLITVSAAGKKSVSKKINIKETALVVDIQLPDAAGDLSAVTIISKKPLITQEDDKTIVDAAALSVSSTNAFEVIEKTPAVVIDQDGNVYLNSATPATIFINGREMKLSSADLASLLKSLPTNSVSKIEILRTPSAKFDAASSGGILNIVLKKGVKLGSSGSVNVAHFQGVYGTTTAGVNFNKSIGKASTYYSYQYTKKNSFEKLISDRKAGEAILSQTAYTTYPSQSHYFSTGVDVALNSKWNTGFDLRLTQNSNQSSALNEIDISLLPTNTFVGKNSSAIGNDNSSVFWQNIFSAKYKIDTSGSEWTNNIEYSYFQYQNNQNYRNNYAIPVRPAIIGDGLLNNKKNIFSFQSDLTYKLPRKYTLETGIKLSISNSNNRANYYIDTGNNIRRVDSLQTNTFSYNETIGAAYLQVSKTFFGFTVKPGLRFETTDIEGRQSVPKDTFFNLKRIDLFPYVFIKHNLFKMFGQMLVANATFRKSIRRPYYESLNPYRKYVDQYLFEVGNPNLKPQFTTNYEFSVNFKEFPVVAIGINDTRDIFSNVTYQDVNTKVALRTFDNLGKNRELYCRIVTGIPPGGKYFFYLGGIYNYNEYRGFYQNLPLNYNRGSFTFFTFHEFKATKTFTLNLQVFMRTRGLQNLYELENFGGMTISANKSIFNKKGNLILAVNDVFRTNYVRFALNQGDISAAGQRINDTRRVGLTFRYNFGIKPKEEKKAGFETTVEGVKD